jgi:acyl carrier protein
MAGISASGLKTQIRSYTEVSSTVLSDTVLEIISAETKTPVKDIDLKADIRDMGIDSLATVEIVVEIEDQLGIEIPEDSVTELIIIEDIIKLCQKLHS